MQQTEKEFQKIKSIKNETGASHFNIKEEQKAQIQVLPDKNVSIPNFIPSKIDQNIFYAHPNTITSMRKDLFFTDGEFRDLQQLAECSNCNKSLDLQFWVRCPHCLGSLQSVE